MTSFWDRLNLRPAERRLVVGVAVVLFIVLNAFLVWPHFKDWNLTKTRFLDAQEKLKAFHGQVSQIEEYKKQVQNLEGAGAGIAEDQDIQLLRAIQMRAAESGVNITQTPRPTTQTNEFFLEQVQSLSVQGSEEQLVNFLYNLGSGNSMVRVRDLSLRPDPPRQQLAGTIKLAASFPRKPTGRSSPAAAPAGKTADAKPATAKR
jgi:Tfp pilus assembly protein PilO